MIKKKAYITKQGQLDYFCGLYSCVNMVSKLADDKLKFSRLSIFRSLVDSLARENALLRVHKNGTSTSQMVKYLRVIKKIFSNQHNVRLKFEQPHIDQKNRNESIIKAFREYSSQPDTAVIFSFKGYPVKHWSCVSHTTPKTAQLLDSWSYSSLKLDAIGRLHEIDDVFVVRAEMPR